MICVLDVHLDQLDLGRQAAGELLECGNGHDAVGYVVTSWPVSGSVMGEQAVAMAALVMPRQDAGLA
jgi:hypothetical protein